MTTFKYKAVSNSGVELEGVIDAYDRDEAVLKLRQTCSIVENIAEVKEGITLSGNASKKKVKEKELALACQQFSIILTSGIPIVRAVELVAEQSGDKTLKKILENVAKDVAAGYSLAASFEQRNRNMPSTFIETIRAGEESGSLETAFGRLAEYYTKKGKVHAKIISSLTYPVFVIGVAVIVIMVIMIYAVPTFSSTFETMGIELPWATKALIAVSHFFKNYIIYILGALIVVIIGLRIYWNTEKGKINLSRLHLKLPVIGRISLMSAAGQFAGTLSTMLSAGLPVMRALSVSGNSMSNYYLGQAVMDAVAGVESGRRIGECLAATGKFPNLLVEMTSVGEESGSLEETLRVIGVYYDSEVETATSRAVSLLEPIIICVLAVFVIFVLMAVYLPMFSMYGSIG